jgi:hypothetical protein
MMGIVDGGKVFEVSYCRRGEGGRTMRMRMTRRRWMGGWVE